MLVKDYLILFFVVTVFAFLRVYFIRKFQKGETPSESQDLRLNDLYEFADRIKDWKNRKHSNTYQHLTFSTRYGGSPKVFGSLNIPVITTSTEPLLMGNMVVYSGKVTVHCRRLEGVLDVDNNQIFEGVNGVLFVYTYHPPGKNGNALDMGVFMSPNIEIRTMRTMEQSFQHSADSLIEQIFEKPDPTMFGNDEFLRLSLHNRLMELQKLAYIQGISDKDVVQSPEP